jgi:hypothetical protein
VAIELKILLYLHRIGFGLRRLGFYSLNHIGEYLLRSKHAVGVQTTVAVNDVNQ